LWGLAFKANTDDMREAPSLSLIDDLTREGAGVQAYDPAAGNEARKLFEKNGNVKIVDSAIDALEGADALAIVTEWQEFRSPDFARGTRAGGPHRSRGRAPGWRGQRRVELQGAERAHPAPLGGGARRAGREAGEASQGQGHRGEPASRPRPANDAEAARHRQEAAAAAHRLREAAFERGARLEAGGVQAGAGRLRRGHPLGLRQGRPRAHRGDDPQRTPRRQARAGGPQGRRLFAI